MPTLILERGYLPNPYMAIELLHPYAVIGSDELQRKSLRTTDFPGKLINGVAADAFEINHPTNQVVDGQTPTITRLLKAGIQTPGLLADRLAVAWKQAQALRHSGVIDARDAVQWIVNVAFNDPSRLQWHIDRLDGVSASTGYAYIAESRGSRSFFTCGRELDESRLMRRTPVEPTWPMYRGTMLEEVARQLFYDTYVAFKPDPVSLEAARSVRGTPSLPWLIGNPDDIALNSNGNQQRRVLIDYKCPTALKNEMEKPPMDYTTQLHHYALMAAAAMRPVSKAMILNLYVAEDIARLWSDMIDREGPDGLEFVMRQARYMMDNKLPLIELTPQVVPLNPAYIEEMKRVYAQADRRVLAGTPAPWPKKKEIEIEPEALERAQRIEGELTRALIWERALKEHADVMKREVKSIFSDTSLTGKKSPLPLLAVQSNRSFDLPKAVEYLKANGFDTKSICKQVTSETYERKVVEAVLEKLDVPIENFVSQDVTVGLARAKTGPVFDRIDHIRQSAIANVAESFPYDPPTPQDAIEPSPPKEPAPAATAVSVAPSMVHH